jgi:hypothetical protein
MNKKHTLSVLFLIPISITLLAFGYIFDIKNTELKENETLIFSAKITHLADSLIHNIQIERGLSAGFLASKDMSSNKEKLIKQQNSTDKFYNNFIKVLQNTQEQKKFNKLIQDKKILSEIKIQMDKIKSIRERVLSHNISFNNEIKYYSNINTKLLNIIHNFAIFDTKNNYEGILIYDIETLKENLGLERAYIYNQLLSTKTQDTKYEKIKELIITQKVLRKNFLLDATPQIKEFYNRFVDEFSLEEIQNFRDAFLSKKLSSLDAKRWFVLSTNFIDRHEALSMNILDLYRKNIEQNYDKAQNTIYIISLFLILYIILTLIVSYIFRSTLVR